MTFLFKLFKPTAAQFAASGFLSFVFICSINIHPLVSDFQRKLSLADNGLAVNSSSFVSKCLQAGVKCLNQNLKGQSPPFCAQGWRGIREMRMAFLHPSPRARKVGGRCLRVVKPSAAIDAWPPAFPRCCQRRDFSLKDTALL